MGLIHFLNECGLLGHATHFIQKDIGRSSISLEAQARVMDFARATFQSK